MTTIKLQNILTGKFYAHGAWNSDFKNAEKVEKNSPTHSVIRYTWVMTHVIEIGEDYEKGMELLAKAEAMRANAGLNRATNSRNKKVERMMIGRADALEVKARKLMHN